MATSTPVGIDIAEGASISANEFGCRIGSPEEPFSRVEDRKGEDALDDKAESPLTDGWPLRSVPT